MTSQRRVAVVGAGVAGLTAIKSCLDDGLEPVCFELRSDIGGLWNYSDHCYPDDGARPYESLITNTSKWTTPFSDFPFPEDCPPLFSYSVFFSYLRNYANHFNLTKHIRFDTKVLSVSQSTDYDDTGRWIVKTETLGSVRSEVFDCVMVCSGFCKTPRMPKMEGIETFGGEVEHSQTYRSNLKYKNQCVLLIGNGNSAGDIASDISLVAKQVYLSIGDGCWMAPRTGFDYNTRRRIIHSLPPFLFNRFLELCCNFNINHTEYAIRPDCPPLEGVIMVNDDVPKRIACGKIIVTGRVVSLGENEARCEDGAVIGGLDVVMFATGYDRDVSFITPSIEEPNGRIRCYKMIFPVEHSHDTLAMIGSILKTIGPAPPVYELQARLASRVLAGKHQLPDRNKMAKEIDECNEMIVNKFGRYNYKFENIEYRDNLAKELCIKPGFVDFLRNPKMAWTYYFDPAFPVHHRLVGNGALPTAMSVCDLARRDTFARQLRKLKSSDNSSSHIVAILFVLTLTMSVLLFHWI